MQKITPFLRFDTQAEEAANLYTSVFKNSKITSVQRYPEGGPMPAGGVMTVAMELHGIEFVALNAGPMFKFTEAVSFVINCDTQEEVDYYREKLTADGGEESQCWWLKDKFGLSWQVVPTQMNKYFSGPDAEANKRAMQAMMQMKKLDLNVIKQAYENA